MAAPLMPAYRFGPAAACSALAIVQWGCVHHAAQNNALVFDADAVSGLLHAESNLTIPQVRFGGGEPDAVFYISSDLAGQAALHNPGIDLSGGMHFDLGAGWMVFTPCGRCRPVATTAAVHPEDHACQADQPGMRAQGHFAPEEEDTSEIPGTQHVNWGHSEDRHSAQTCHFVT